MNIAVINYSGNVGKTTLVRHLLAPNLRDHTIVAVETINIDGHAKETLTTSGRKVGKNIDDLIVNSDTIFDVGGSNIEGFLAELKKRDGAHQDIDLFLVPVVSDRKIMGDTINIISELSGLGVPPKKIKIIFNRIDPDDEELLEEVFEPIYAFYNYKGDAPENPLSPLFELSNKWVIFKTEVFETSRNMKNPDGNPLTVYELASDPTDYKRLVKETSNPEQKRLYASRLAAVRMAKSAKAHLDSVFADFISPPIIKGEKK